MFEKRDASQPSPGGDLTHELNESQLTAVTAKPGNQLVLAGAGSGKTRVLAHRMAYLIHHYDRNPFGVMAVTFTNKAAREMGQRIEKLLGMTTSNMWMGTFHSLANRFLRYHTELAGLPQNFQIIDTDEQARVAKRIIQELDDEDALETKITPKEFCNWVSRRKDDGQRLVDVAFNYQNRDFIKIYERYEPFCKQFGLVDFGELLLRCFELFRDNDSVLNKYRNQFSEILVDEFQDTNAIQYRWLRILAGDTANVMAVGDDDQSIYGWRGAVIGNIRSFQTDFRNTQLVKLEENYRSTKTILNAANKVIEQNFDRLGKTLWTRSDQGIPIQLYRSPEESLEVSYVVGQVKNWVDESNEHSYSDVAILYRAHYLSRSFESGLTAEGIPYTIRGGLRFYSRAEIKDALAYMQLVANPAADLAFERVLSYKPRGMGAQSKGRIAQLANELNCSFWEASIRGIEKGVFSTQLHKNLSKFLSELTGVVEQCKGQELREIARICVEESGLLEHHGDDKAEPLKALTRVENLQELVRAASIYSLEGLQSQALSSNESLLQRFLDLANLDQGDMADVEPYQVNLMTIHAAKGLEFPVVFMVGMSEGVFPSSQTLHDPKQILEERRLAYVGMTRAEKQLHMSYTIQYVGRPSSNDPSRFIEEIPPEYVDDINPVKPKPYMPSAAKGMSKWGRSSGRLQDEVSLRSRRRFQVGDNVVHGSFGRGVVLQVDGYGSSERVLIDFEDIDSVKTILATATLLEKAG